MNGDIVFVEQDPRFLPARLETAALGARLGALSFLYSVTFYFISLCFPHRASGWDFLRLEKENFLQVITREEVGWGGHIPQRKCTYLSGGPSLGCRYFCELLFI